MRTRFVNELKTKLAASHFNVTELGAPELFVWEVQTMDTDSHPIRQTRMEATQPVDLHFKLRNAQPNNQVAHICVDGDLIPYGQEKYDHTSPKHSDGRPDAIVFDDQMLLLVELKLAQEDASEHKEDPKWKSFFYGVAQIEDFVRFLQNNQINLASIFAKVQAVVCMRFEPRFESNTRRNTELFKRSKQLGFLISAHNHTNYFKL
ncbi:MAG: hypothetical protein MUC97_10360 [Bernardetiaceae bacterium]|jgi:hypothetical protein|nr:hypothetical protein [Bernardetiaceae bacterium]